MKIIHKATIEKLYAGNVITAANVPQEAFEGIIKAMGSHDLIVWADMEFDPAKPPMVHAGATICPVCGKLYWCTPFEDSLERFEEEGPGRICERCAQRLPMKKIIFICI